MTNLQIRAVILSSAVLLAPLAAAQEAPRTWADFVHLEQGLDQRPPEFAEFFPAEGWVVRRGEEAAALTKAAILDDVGTIVRTMHSNLTTASLTDPAMVFGGETICAASFTDGATRGEMRFTADGWRIGWFGIRSAELGTYFAFAYAESPAAFGPAAAIGPLLAEQVARLVVRSVVFNRMHFWPALSSSTVGFDTAGSRWTGETPTVRFPPGSSDQALQQAARDYVWHTTVCS